MVRPCVARGFVELAFSGLASMYPVSDWSCLLRTNMDISARAISLTDRPQRGHVGHQGSHAPGRPILHLFSFSRRPRRVRVFLSHPYAPRFAPFLFLCPAAVPSSPPPGATGWPVSGPR